MAEEKSASLTVLGGPLAGVRAELPEDGVVTLGSAPDCTVLLDAPGVSPVHARIVLEGGQATVHSTGAEQPVHINDTPLDAGSATLRNGDILWLGVPGEDDVVMLQCVLPAVAVPPPPPAVSRAVPTPEVETTALWTTPPTPDSAPASRPDTPGAARTGDEPTIALTPEQIQASGDAPAEEPAPPPGSPPAADEPLFIALDAQTEDEAVPIGAPDLVSAEDIAPVTLGDAADEAVIVDEDELFSAAAPTFVGVRPDTEEGSAEPDDEATIAQPLPDVVVPDAPSPEPPPAVPGPSSPDASNLPVGEIVEDAVPVVDPEPTAPAPAGSLPDESAPTVAIPAPARPDASSPAPSVPPSASTPEAPRPADRSTPAARRPARPSTPDASLRGARRPGRSSHPAASQRRRPASARPASPPGETHDDAGELADEEPERSPVLLAAAGFAGVVLVIALGWAVWRFVLAKPAPAPTPAPVAAATAAPPPAPVAPPVAEPTPEAVSPAETRAAAPAPTPLPTPTPPPPTAAAPAQPTPTPPPAAAPTPTPTPTPTPPPAAPAPPQPSAAELQAQQTAQRVETLLGQADAALASGQHDTAVTRFTEALNLDPQSTRAQTGRARAIALRDLAKRRFVPTRTRVQTEKEQGGGIAGFDMGDAELRKTPDFQGRIEFEMNPATGLQGGTAWTLRVFVVNEGEKPIRIQGVDAVTQVNGSGSESALSPRTRQIPTQQRLLVGELTGTWSEGTNAWSTQVTVTANKGDSLRATLTWR